MHAEPIPLTKWLTLSQKELVALKPLLFLKNKYEKNSSLTQDEEIKLKKIITQLDPHLFIKHAISDSIANEFYHLTILDELWDQKWIACSQIDNAGNLLLSSTFSYQKQPSLPSFDLLKGSYLYAKYLIYNVRETNHAGHIARDYLFLAAEIGIFAAINLMFKQCLDAPDKSLSFFYAQRAAKLYLTPGYLLLAILYCHCDNYKEALNCFLLAYKLLPESQILINNAYRGESIDNIISPIFKNWANGIQLLAEQAKIPLSDVTGYIDNTLKITAEHILQEFQHQFKDTTKTASATSELAIG